MLPYDVHGFVGSFCEHQSGGTYSHRCRRSPQPVNHEAVVPGPVKRVLVAPRFGGFEKPFEDIGRRVGLRLALG